MLFSLCQHHNVKKILKTCLSRYKLHMTTSNKNNFAEFVRHLAYLKE